MTTLPYGVRVVGHKAGERRLVDHQAALSAYAECDPRANIEREGYLTHFRFGKDFRRLFESQRSERGYNGVCGADSLYWDIDRPGDFGKALSDARRLCGAILDRYRELDDDDVLIFISGGKGLHVGIPCALWDPEPSLRFHEVAKRFALAHAERAGVAIDTMLYSKTRLLRAPNSKHPSGLHKRRISLDELTYLSPDAIIQRAVEPEPFELPTSTTTSPTAAADWLDAVRTVERNAAKPRPALRDGIPKLPGFLQRFLRDGELDPEQRAVSTFRAAAALSELYHAHGFEALAHALLTEAALDSGLTPSETKRQIECGIAHARQQLEGGAS